MIPLAILRRFGPYLAGIALAALLFVWIDHRGYARGVASQQPTITALNTTIANYRTAREKARADDTAHALAVERANQEIQAHASDDYAANLAALRTRADDYTAKLRVARSADPGRGGGANLPGATSAAGGADPAAGLAVVPEADLGLCAAAVANAEGWQGWWKRIAAGESMVVK